MLFGVAHSRVVDVDRSEDRKDVGLQECNENLKGGQEEQHAERQNAHWDKEHLACFSKQQRLSEQRERYEQDVTRQHVGHESDGERERRDNDG